jgi:predicted fused transcriptional regulator/phosphomethylpyrimidine kinase
MGEDHELGEDVPMADEPEGMAEVQQRLREIQRRKRGNMRWHVSRHTAELAIDALERTPRAPTRSAKGRRRKRAKRLL